MQHIGTFLHNEMGISMGGISPMCDRSSIQLQKIFFLRSIDGLLAAPDRGGAGAGGGKDSNGDRRALKPWFGFLPANHISKETCQE
jgi:hypothetical protein